MIYGLFVQFKKLSPAQATTAAARRNVISRGSSSAKAKNARRGVKETGSSSTRKKEEVCIYTGRREGIALSDIHLMNPEKPNLIAGKRMRAAQLLIKKSGVGGLRAKEREGGGGESEFARVCKFEGRSSSIAVVGGRG